MKIRHKIFIGILSALILLLAGAAVCFRAGRNTVHAAAQESHAVFIASMTIDGNITNYGSLDEAFSAAVAAGTSKSAPAVVRLEQDCTRTTAFSVPQNRHVVIELGGNVLTSTASRLLEVGRNASLVIQNGCLDIGRVNANVQSGGSVYLTGLYFSADFEVASLMNYVDPSRQTMVDLSARGDHYGDPAYRQDFPLGLYEIGGLWTVSVKESIFYDGEPVAEGEDFSWNHPAPENTNYFYARITEGEDLAEEAFTPGLPAEIGDYAIRAELPVHVIYEDTGVKALYWGTTYHFQIGICKAVASLTEEGEEVLFASLSEAFDHVGGSGAEQPAAICLVDDYEALGQLRAAGGNILLDLNGFILRLSGAEMTVAEGARLTVTGGYLDGAENGIQLGGALLLENVYVSAALWSEALAGCLAQGQIAVTLSDEAHYGDTGYRAEFPHAVYKAGSLSLGAADNVVYDGESVQAGVDLLWSTAIPRGVEVTYSHQGGAGLPSAAGTHRITASVPAFVAAEDGVKTYYAACEVQAELTIARAVPAYTLPDGLTVRAGKTLSSVALPEGWAWRDGDIAFHSEGEHTATAVYTPNDVNYESVVAELRVTVLAAKGLSVYAIILIAFAMLAVGAGVGAILVYRHRKEIHKHTIEKGE